MPFYEYQCQACGAQVEVLQKINDAPLKKCPECGKSKLKKLVSAPVFRLKGGGWYETDFKSDKENKRNLVGAEKGGDEKSESKAESKPEAKSEAKPDAKAESKPVDKPAEKSASKSAAKAKSRPAPVRKATPARKPPAKGKRK